MANQPKNNPRNSNLGNYALGDKLKKFTPNIKTKRVFEDVKKVTDLGPDGEDHINIYLNCKTPLGQALSPFTINPFIDRFYGKFNSRQGFYYYLLSKDGHEAFRIMHPIKMRNYAANLPTMGYFSPNLRYFMATALWSQIKDNEAVKQQLIDNQLPFEAYYLKRQKFENTVSHIPARPNGNAVWITRIVTVIANALKENKVPVFDEFIDNAELLEKLKSKISRPLTPPPPPKAKKEKVKKPEVVAPEVDLAPSVTNVVHQGLAFKSVPGKGWVAGMPETTPLEAFSSAVAAEQNVAPEVDSSIPAGVEGGPALPDEAEHVSTANEGLEAINELRDALVEGSNGVGTNDLTGTGPIVQPLDEQPVVESSGYQS